jgi:hypothetical protein
LPFSHQLDGKLRDKDHRPKDVESCHFLIRWKCGKKKLLGVRVLDYYFYRLTRLTIAHRVDVVEAQALFE